MMMNVWKSIYTGQEYEMPMDWMPKFGGWELIGTVEKQERGDEFTSSLLLSTADQGLKRTYVRLLPVAHTLVR